MKKYFLALLLSAMIASVAVAYPVASSESEKPAAGVFKQLLSSTQVLGAKSQIGGATFKYVLNNNETQKAFRGEPAFYDITEATDYHVNRYGTSGSFEAYAGQWYCDINGDGSVDPGAMGWIQIAGVTVALVSWETVSIGDILMGTVYNVTTNEAGGRHLRRKGAAVDGTASWEVTTRWPKAMEARDFTTKPVWMKIFIKD
jgi:hypothetical protein